MTGTSLFQDMIKYFLIYVRKMCTVDLNLLLHCIYYSVLRTQYPTNIYVQNIVKHVTQMTVYVLCGKIHD